MGRRIPGSLISALALVAGLLGGSPSPALAAGSEQSIWFLPPFDAAVGDTLQLNGRASSGLPVSYTVDESGVCTVNGSRLTFATLGNCVVTAHQAGNATWAPAPDSTWTVESRFGYAADWTIDTPDGSTRTPGTVRVGDEIHVTLSAMGGNSVASCTLQITSAGGWVMNGPGRIDGGACKLSFILPAFPAPNARVERDRVDADVCVSVSAIELVGGLTPAMATADRTTPGGVTCYNGWDRSERTTSVLDFQVVDGGTPRTFTSDPPLVSWNPADWVDYTGFEFGRTTHLEVASSAEFCQFQLVGDWQTGIVPGAVGGSPPCQAWDVRLPGVLPATMPDGGLPGIWQTQIAVNFRTSAGWGQTVAAVWIPYAPSDGVFESSLPAMFPVDLATTRFVTENEEWLPAFKVSGATPTECVIEIIHPNPATTNETYDASAIDTDGTCHFEVPARVPGESRQYWVEATTGAGVLEYGASISAIPVPTPPTIDPPTPAGGDTEVDVSPGSGQGLLLDLNVTAGTETPPAAAAAGKAGKKAAPTAASTNLCPARSVSANGAGGGTVDDINARCHLVPGTYTATARMIDAAGKITTSTREFVVTPANGSYRAISPARVLDTRPTGSGVTNMGLKGKFTAGTPRTFAVGGAHYVGGGSAVAVPANAIGVTGNLTVTRQTAAGTITLGPTTASTTGTGTLAFAAGENRADNVTIGLGSSGTLTAVFRSATAGATADVIFDVTGYFYSDATGSTYHPVAPGRVLDTRPSGTGVTHIGLAGKFPNKTVRTVAVAGVKGLGWPSALVPANASAVTANVTVTNASSDGFVAIGPTMTATPRTSTVNTKRGVNTANGITVALRSGKLQAVWVGTAGSAADVIVDITGYFTADATGLRFYPVDPYRALDTKTGVGLTGTFATGTARSLTVGSGVAGAVPVDAAAIAANLTVSAPTSNGYAFAAPSISGTPTSSTVNATSGLALANGFDVALDGGSVGLIWVGGAGSTADMQLDVTGYWK